MHTGKPDGYKSKKHARRGARPRRRARPRNWQIDSQEQQRIQRGRGAHQGWSKKRVEALCDRLLCETREGSSRTEGRSLRAVGRRSDRRRQWKTDSAHLDATSDPGGSQKKGNPEAADQILGQTTWEPSVSDMCADTEGSETLLQQGASRPPEGRLHTETHITARAAGQPAHPGSGGHARAQAAHGEDSPWGPARTPRASPTTSPQQRGEGNEATKGDPPPPHGRPGKRPCLAPRAAARPRAQR